MKASARAMAAALAQLPCCFPDSDCRCRGFREAANSVWRVRSHGGVADHIHTNSGGAPAMVMTGLIEF
jgi:hypothetical protein